MLDNWWGTVMENRGIIPKLEMLCSEWPYDLHSLKSDVKCNTSPNLVGALEHEFYEFPLRISSSQLTFTPSFFKMVKLHHQPEIIVRY
jgi:hypothetical protein